MPTPRAQQVSLEATALYHCISRCVRRAFLCGQDPLTGRNFDHRKQWLVDRVHELAAIFALDVCGYSVLSNHFHLVLRLDRDRARAWTDEQVAERYARVFPQVVRKTRCLAAPVRARRLELWRQRLWDLSWFMRCLNESIARRANQEDGCTGRFWEGRFRSQALLDEGALLACLSYVDLNPIRAGLADSLAGSAFTSIRERLSGTPTSLVPFAEETPSNPAREPLPVTREAYVELLEWTVQGLREAQRAAVPAPIGVTLERFDLEPGRFVDTVRDYARNFFTMVGQVHRITVESQRRGYRRRPGVRSARRMYRRTAA
jgi:putative transposase